MSIENILADTNINYTLNGGICHIKASRCRTRINKSENPERDILSYLNETKGCKISALCRRTGCSRYRVSQILNTLSVAGKIHTVTTYEGRKSIMVYPN